jgi:iron complex transport system substrate-binding protein
MGAPEADDVFPRTITHFGGVTTIAAPPQRVVVIGTGQTDAILTLGVVPVGAASGDDADFAPTPRSWGRAQGSRPSRSSG